MGWNSTHFLPLKCVECVSLSANLLARNISFAHLPCFLMILRILCSFYIWQYSVASDSCLPPSGTSSHRTSVSYLIPSSMIPGQIPDQAKHLSHHRFFVVLAVPSAWNSFSLMHHRTERPSLTIYLKQNPVALTYHRPIHFLHGDTTWELYLSMLTNFLPHGDGSRGTRDQKGLILPGSHDQIKYLLQTNEWMNEM